MSPNSFQFVVIKRSRCVLRARKVSASFLAPIFQIIRKKGDEGQAFSSLRCQKSGLYSCRVGNTVERPCET
jgi:hypothetical protein